MDENKSLKSKILEYISNFIVVGVPLIVFFIPTDILDRCEICLNFTNFMKQYFISISIFESASNIPQVTAFYASFMHIWGVMAGVMMILTRKNKRLTFSNKSSDIIKVFLSIAFIASFFYINYNGHFAKDVIEHGLTNRTISKPADMGNRSTMLFYCFLANFMSIALGVVLAYIFIKELLCRTIENIKRRIK